QAASVPVVFDEHHLSEVQNTASEEKLDRVVDSMKESKVALIGKIHTPMEYKGDLASYDMRLRTLSSPSQGGAGDLLGGCAVCDPPCAPLCAPLCPQSVKGVIECLKIITRAKSQRIPKFAFDYATKKGRAKVTAVHKANIICAYLKFLPCCFISWEVPFVALTVLETGNCALQVPPGVFTWHKPHSSQRALEGPSVTPIPTPGPGRAGGPSMAFSPPQVLAGRSRAPPWLHPQGTRGAPLSPLLSLRELFLLFTSSFPVSPLPVLDLQVRTRDLGGYSTTSDFVKSVIDNLHPH
ncbi:hypothetical protein N305_08546, partial [Manacus vitellinus]